MYRSDNGEYEDWKMNNRLQMVELKMVDLVTRLGSRQDFTVCVLCECKTVGKG
ncbi:hypothetical protein Hanom_Chr02g00160111 [Helianthus anomalus]